MDIENQLNELDNLLSDNVSASIAPMETSGNITPKPIRKVWPNVLYTEQKCTECGELGETMERRPNGMARCKNGHAWQANQYKLNEK